MSFICAGLLLYKTIFIMILIMEIHHDQLVSVFIPIKSQHLPYSSNTKLPSHYAPHILTVHIVLIVINRLTLLNEAA